MGPRSAIRPWSAAVSKRCKASTARPAAFKTAGEKGAAAPTDAGVALYGQSADLANSQETVNTAQKRKAEAKRVLEDKEAPAEKKDKANDDLKKIDEVEKLNDKAVAAVARQAQDRRFIAGFGSNGGEEFLSFMNISETLLVRAARSGRVGQGHHRGRRQGAGQGRQLGRPSLHHRQDVLHLGRPAGPDGRSRAAAAGRQSGSEEGREEGTEVRSILQYH